MVRASALLLVAALASTARAEPDPEGAKLFERGRALAKQAKWAEACDTFERSLAIDPAMGTKLNYGDCHEHLDHLAEAWRQFDGVAEAEKITNPSRAKYARERADALLPRLGIVVLTIASPSAAGLVVKIGDRQVNPAAVVHEVVDPGTVEISARASTGAPFSRSEDVAAGKTISVEVPAFGSAAPAPEQVVVSTLERRRSRVYLAYGLGAGGVLAFASSIAVALSARADYVAQFDNHECMRASGGPICSPAGYAAQQDALRKADIGTVVGVGGLALLAAGAVVFVTAPRDLVVTPTADSQSAGLAVVGNF